MFESPVTVQIKVSLSWELKNILSYRLSNTISYEPYLIFLKRPVERLSWLTNISIIEK